MTLYNIFDTEEDAIAAESSDFQQFISIRAEDIAYCTATVRWAEIRQRLDGKYVYPVCPVSSAVYITEEYSEDWFPQESEE